MSLTLFAILSTSSIFAAGGQILFKLGSPQKASLLDFVNWKIGAGLCFYGAGMALWLFGLSRAPLHLVYPFTILTFIFVGLSSIFILHERTTILTLTGWTIICFGFIILQFDAK